VTENVVTQPGELQNGNYFVQGGGIYNAGTVNIESSSVTSNSAEFNVATPAGQGDNLGDNDANSNEGDGSGNGLNGNVVVEGGGIYNSGNLTVTSSSISKNSATSTVINGSLNPAGGIGNGDSNGDNTSGNFDGSFNGSGVNGNITVEGGGIYNAGATTLMGGSLTGNSATSNVTNGSHNGDNNGDSGNESGAFNGNGVKGNITVAGGGIFSPSRLSATSTGLSGNFAASTVVNGSSNGDGNGDATEGGDGNDNGNGVDGNILVAGGAIAKGDNLGNAVLAMLNQCNVSGNSVTSSITNGSGNGQNDGDSDGAGGEANNGNGVTGTVVVVGGGIHDDGEVTITAGSVSHNSATSFVTNGNGNGFTCGNSANNSDILADDGDGLAGNLTVQGGGINNAHAGRTSITSATVSDNTASSSVTNGFEDGNGCGNSNHNNDVGGGAGNGLTGNLLVGGGAMANNGMLEVNKCTLTANSLKSTISNGNNNGLHDGQLDTGNDSGNNCGNGVGVDDGGVVVKVAGGAILNTGSTTVTSCSITGNSASSSVTNAAGNGQGDNTGSTGANGLGDGDGVNGNVEVVGGGTANLGAPGSLGLVSTTPSNNHVSSSPTSGSGNLTSDGVVVDGTVTVSGPDTFATVVHGALGNALESQTGHEVASFALPPSGSVPSMMLDSRQPSSPIQGNQRTLMELPASGYEAAGTSAHTAIPALHRPSHSMEVDAFFLDAWDEGLGQALAR
jgi:hypothetical protein